MKSIGEQEAKNDKVKMKTKNSHEILRLMMNEAKLNAYNNEINKELTQEEKNELITAGEQEAQNDAQKQLNEMILTNRKAQFALAKQKANNDFMESKEMKEINEKIIQKEVETKRMEEETAQRDIMMQAQKQVQKAYITNAISSHFVDANLSATEQVKYAMDTIVNPKTAEFNEKDKLALKFRELLNTHADAWKAFSAQNSKMTEMLDNFGYLNINIDELKNMIEMFNKFWPSYTPPPPPQELSFYDNDNNNNNNN